MQMTRISYCCMKSPTIVNMDMCERDKCMYKHEDSKDEFIDKTESDEDEMIYDLQGNELGIEDKEEDLANRTFGNPSQSDESDSSTTSAKIEKCNFCDFKTKMTKDLKEHKENSHSLCGICDTMFNCRQMLITHKNVDHKKR